MQNKKYIRIVINEIQVFFFFSNTIPLLPVTDKPTKNK